MKLYCIFFSFELNDVHNIIFLLFQELTDSEDDNDSDIEADGSEASDSNEEDVEDDAEEHSNDSGAETGTAPSAGSSDESSKKPQMKTKKQSPRQKPQQAEQKQKKTISSVDILANKIKETTVSTQPVQQKGNYNQLVLRDTWSYISQSLTFYFCWKGKSKA